MPSPLRTVVAFLCLTCVETVQYGHNYVYVRRDNKAVAANFEDVQVQGHELLSPAFVRPESVPARFANGTDGPTSDVELEYFLRSVASRNDWMTYHVADFKSEEGRSFPYLLLSTSSQDLESQTNSSEKLRVWVQGAVHGNEPAGDQSLLALIGKMDKYQTWTQSILQTMDIFVLPRYNPDGVEYFQRASASNLDPNRDHIKLARQQTRDIKSTFSRFGPHIAIDMHEFSGPTRYAGSYVHASDALFAAAKNLNINANIRQMSEDLFAVNVGTALDTAGLRWGPYVTGSTSAGSTIRFAEASSDAKIGRNAMGLTQCITFLCETRGIGLADQHFRRRTVASLVMVEAIIQTAADNAERVRETITNGIVEFIESNSEIVVTDSTTYSNRTFQMIDVRNGNVVDVPIQFASTTPTTANLTRLRPEAYIIPRAWADLAAHLEVSGLEVKSIPKSFRGRVEALKITSVSFEKTYYEGVVPVKVTTSTLQKEIELPAGSFVISTRQRNAALGFVALEPENIDSYVASNIIPVEEGEEYPVYRVMAW